MDPVSPPSQKEQKNPSDVAPHPADFAPPASPTNKYAFSQPFSTFKQFLPIITILFLLVAIPVTFTLTQTQQDVRQRAETAPVVPPDAAGTISAFPNPCHANSLGSCTTTISWNTTNVKNGSVCATPENGTSVIFVANINGKGSQVAPFISNAYSTTFSLHADGCTSKSLSNVAVKAE